MNNLINYSPKIGDLVYGCLSLHITYVAPMPANGSDGQYPFEPSPILSICKHYYRVPNGTMTKNKSKKFGKKEKRLSYL